ncbi:MAG: DUF2071 domain-containing protein [Pedobacter sp.]|jgi:hypothetical protein|uniref:YqjF family protein n=1 Tax=Pedobacter sp. TaxID=1411316 RepID=UPI00356574A4
MTDNDIFLTAEWRKLILINYTVDKKILEKYLPPFTELDDWHGKHYVSIVGFMFKNTKLKGLSIPFHGNFEEVNLRFYVKYNENGVWKRGAVFISEIVPKLAITFIANTIYKESYRTLPMKHKWTETNEQLNVEYAWKNGAWNRFSVTANPKSEAILLDSDAYFITEHYWGYTKIGKNITSEYGVGHPKWETYPILDYSIDIDFEKNYGKDFSNLKDVKPNSIMLVEGSKVFVKKGRKIRI